MSNPTPSPYDPDRSREQPDERRDSDAGHAYGGQAYGGQPAFGGQGQQGQPSYGGQEQYRGEQYGSSSYGSSSYGSSGQQYYGAQRSTNTMALISLISGIAGLTVLFLIGSIVAVVTGHIARRQIAETGEEGSGFATAGLVMGWIGVAIGVVGAVLFVLFFGAIAAGVSTVGTT